MKKVLLTLTIGMVASLCFAQVLISPSFKKYVINSNGEVGDFADITDTVSFGASLYLPTFEAPNGYVHYNFFSILTAGTDSVMVQTGSIPFGNKKLLPADTVNVTWLDSTRVLTATKTDVWPVLVGKPAGKLVCRVKSLGTTTGCKARRFIIEYQ